MEKVIWSQRSLDDLAEIVRFISRDNQDAAAKVGQGIINLTNLVAAFPKMGRIDLKEKVPIRITHFGKYLIFYQFREDARVVEIVRIIHGARQRPDLSSTDF